MTDWSDAALIKLAYNRQRARAYRELAYRHNDEFIGILDEYLASDPDYRMTRASRTALNNARGELATATLAKLLGSSRVADA